MGKIAVTTTSFGEYDSSALEACGARGHTVVKNPYGRKVTSEELIELAAGAAGILAGTEEISAEVISRLPGLKVISRCGAGVDSVDLDAARKAGVKVFNTPDAPTLAVAELTVALILDVLRKVSLQDRDIKAGRWKKRMGSLLSGKSVGIIGYGKIGRKVGSLLMALGCRISYYDTDTSLKADKDASRVSLDDLLMNSDIITMHVSGACAAPVISDSDFRKMKKGVVIINTSRGNMADEASLYAAIKKGVVAGAALDVFGAEPYIGPLRELENVVLTPHIGSYAKEARIAMEKEAMDNLLKGLEDKK